ncbi:MAG: ATPase [Clostridiales bacterium]|jgi:V/A-type H+-transporting ATPase subunit I|nr:ATPase [Clostridiales bacterium]
MTEKMKYINIMGSMKDIDRVIEKYISKYDIQLEYTAKELANEKDLLSIQVSNPYTSILRKAEKIYHMTGLSDDVKSGGGAALSAEEAVKVIDYAAEYLDHVSNDVSALKAKKESYQAMISELQPFADLDFGVESLRCFEYIKYQFGKMPLSSFKQFETFLYNNPEIFFVSGAKDANYIWGVYFAADSYEDKVDSMFSSLHFEKMNLPFSLGDEYFTGNPASLIAEISDRLARVNAEIDALEKRNLRAADQDDDVAIDLDTIASAYQRINELAFYYDTRKYAAKTMNDFYIFVGWMVDKEAAELEKVLAEDADVVFIYEENNEAIISSPPTKLNNRFLFQPFELFIRMYGLPTYGEIDPTPFVAITYTLLFGVMFGDAGQGLVLALLGLFLWKKKGIVLGSVMTVIGCSSAVFGLLFGSFFGIEFTPLWMHPAEPENINTILLYAVSFGMFLILVAMVINVINAVRKKEYRRIIFDPNGLLGLVFYGGIVGMAYLVFLGNGQLMLWLIIVFAIVPLILMAFRAPILSFLEKKKELIHGGLGLFLFETVIEAFEMVLSYFTNTVSFVRVGAFALSHASMMGVVMMLSATADGGNNIAVIILGNLLVMCLEGLIVGIQVLRLEFYEMFSRFYTGTGREFVPYKKLYK